MKNDLKRLNQGWRLVDYHENPCERRGEDQEHVLDIAEAGKWAVVCIQACEGSTKPSDAPVWLRIVRCAKDNRRALMEGQVLNQLTADYGIAYGDLIDFSDRNVAVLVQEDELEDFVAFLFDSKVVCLPLQVTSSPEGTDGVVTTNQDANGEESDA